MSEAKEAIMAQIHAAFGQGTGPVRVSRDAMMALNRFYNPKITDEVVNGWDDGGTQALERVRAVGRMAASRVAMSGRTTILSDDVTESATLVADRGNTLWCQT